MRAVARPFGNVLFWIAAVSCVAIAAISLRFVPFGVRETMDFLTYQLQGNALFLYGHIGFAPVALALLPLQLMPSLRQARPRLHRWMGRISVLAILIAGFSGLDLALTTQSGTVAATGFGLLAVLWLVVTGTGFYFGFRRRLAEHRVWMLRSAALTFAAVTLRLYLPLSLVSGADFDAAYSIIAWACWVPNAIAMELYLRAAGRKRERLIPA